eukprot:COSAG01_NODE_2377_length_7801_cov_4.201117_5_plen_232_part_00
MAGAHRPRAPGPWPARPARCRTTARWRFHSARRVAPWGSPLLPTRTALPRAASSMLAEICLCHAARPPLATAPAAPPAPPAHPAPPRNRFHGAVAGTPRWRLLHECTRWPHRVGTRCRGLHHLRAEAGAAVRQVTVDRRPPPRAAASSQPAPNRCLIEAPWAATGGHGASLTQPCGSPHRRCHRPARCRWRGTSPRTRMADERPPRRTPPTSAPLPGRFHPQYVVARTGVA